MTRLFAFLTAALAMAMPASADAALRGAPCGEALQAAVELAAAEAAPVTITHVRCGGGHEIVEIRRIAMSGQTLYDVRVRESRQRPRILRAADARDFSTDSPARIIRVR